MTKKIRIENADTSVHKVKVEVFDIATDGSEILQETKDLDYPTAMVELYIHDRRKVVITEKK